MSSREVIVYLMDENSQDIDSLTCSEWFFSSILEKYLPRYYVRYGVKNDDVVFVGGLLYGLHKQRRITTLQQYMKLRARVKFIEVKLI